MDSLDSMGCQWYNFVFFQCFHCFDGTFHCGVQDFMCLQCSQLHKVKSVARSSFDKKNMYTTNIFGMCKCLCEDFQHFNVCACFVKCVFFWNFQLVRISPFMHNCCEKSFKKNIDMMHGKSRNVNLMLVYFQQAMCSTHIYMYIYGSKSFAFVVGALLLLHLWFLNHVAIQCERKGPKRVG